MAGRVFVVVAFVGMTSCVGPDPSTDGEPSDFDPVAWSGGDGKADSSGVPAVFDRNNIMDDSVFTAAQAVNGNAVQAFLEASPYGKSWLATATLDGMRFSDDLIAIATAQNIDPIVLLARMQVESSLVSATTTPSQSRIDAALGCGCPDASACSDQYSGLSRQLRCAAEVLSSKFAESQSDSGLWNKGKTRNTDDPLAVTPGSNATAALYAYTPWVLLNTGGNWLVWNVSRRFLKAFDDAGALNLP